MHHWELCIGVKKRILYKSFAGKRLTVDVCKMT